MNTAAENLISKVLLHTATADDFSQYSRTHKEIYALFKDSAPILEAFGLSIIFSDKETHLTIFGGPSALNSPIWYGVDKPYYSAGKKGYDVRFDGEGPQTSISP